MSSILFQCHKNLIGNLHRTSFLAIYLTWFCCCLHKTAITRAPWKELCKYISFLLPLPVKRNYHPNTRIPGSCDTPTDPYITTGHYIKSISIVGNQEISSPVHFWFSLFLLQWILAAWASQKVDIHSFLSWGPFCGSIILATVTLSNCRQSTQ